MNPELLPIHMRGAADGWPLCWNIEDDEEDDDATFEDTFEGSYDANEVNCSECIELMEN